MWSVVVVVRNQNRGTGCAQKLSEIVMKTKDLTCHTALRALCFGTLMYIRILNYCFKFLDLSYSLDGVLWYSDNETEDDWVWLCGEGKE